MKKILITGANSYVGKSLEKWLGQNPERYLVDSISLRDNLWKEKDFSEYDVVFHTAGIAHIKETKKNADLYYKVNRDLAYEIAEKAKSDGVKQYILLSSMSVYGIESGVINKNTANHPKSHYGKSKLQAEELIKPLGCNRFQIAIIRPPMIYGKDCKGNYPKLVKLALNIPFFPNINNERSMIYIENLCEFVRLLIDDCASGLFFPQNREYVKTSDMVKLISQAHGKQVRLTKLLNFISVLQKVSIVNKMFGTLVYEKKMSEYKMVYHVCNYKESIQKTEQ